MKKRVITAIIALCIFIPIIIIGGTTLQLAAALVAIVGVYELFRMKGLTLLSFEGVIAILSAIILVLPRSLWLGFLPITVSSFDLFYFCVMVLLAVTVFSKNLYTIDEAAFPILVVLYVGMGFQNFVKAASIGENRLVLLSYALLVVWSTDIGAYQFGRLFGKNKLAPSISPNKTIEGALGGTLSAVVVSLIFFVLYPTTDFTPYHTFTMILLTIIFSVVGQLGDLVESAFKRHYGVKDSGKILPGHGGILDRFDSLLFVFPIMHLFGLF